MTFSAFCTCAKAASASATQAKTALYDAANHLVIGPNGFAEKLLLNEPDVRIALVFYGTDGKPVFNLLQGFAFNKTDSRTQGDTINSYHGPYGELITGPEDYAEVHYHWDKGGKLSNAAYLGPDGAPVTGHDGYHRAEWTSGNSSPVRSFDTRGRELASLGPETEAQVIVLSEILDVKQPVAKVGIQAGDILWQYGDWSFPEALAAEQLKGTNPDTILKSIKQGFFTERDRLSEGSAAMTVIRYGKPVQLNVPPLPGKTLGAHLKDRAVPIITFEA